MTCTDKHIFFDTLNDVVFDRIEEINVIENHSH
jgi:hypothetical protein